MFIVNKVSKCIDQNAKEMTDQEDVGMNLYTLTIVMTESI